MNIEESINKIKEVIYMSDGEKVDYIDINHSDLGGEVSVDIFIKAIETLLTAYEKEKEKNKEYKNLLIDMVNQFAYEDNKPKTRGSSEEKLYTGGLSVLEDVFDLLDIDEGIKREDLWKLKEE